MNKSGKTKKAKKNEISQKKTRSKKMIENDENPEFSSEEQYMNYVGTKNEMKSEPTNKFLILK